jgi:hypothetical protein
MQVFLPYADFEQSAKSLDMKRLGKQRVECLQLLNSITKINNGEPIRGWKNHPCRKLWHDYSNALVVYGQVICNEWKSRGYKDTCYEKISKFYNHSKPLKYPPFIGSEEFHRSHRSMLIQKNSDFYRPKFPGTPDNLEYIWPL